MTHFKPHFWHSKSQRNGVLLLIIVIVLLQAYIYYSNTTKRVLTVNNKHLNTLNNTVDSLKQLKLTTNTSYKTYPFNPNYLSDYKAERLGMALEQIDRLFAYRATGKFINTAKEFQAVTKVSDSLLSAIAPLFKFPKWVSAKLNTSKKATRLTKVKRTTTDINLATEKDLQTIYGVGASFSKRIVNYRRKIQGFTYKKQLAEVWGLDTVLVKEILKVFKIIKKPIIKKQNINTITFKQLLQNPYIDYDLCKQIFNYRDEIAEYQDLNQLKNIANFPLEKYDRIVLYLEAK
jgi:hypothetical protein